jgi:hypothetical protein
MAFLGTTTLVILSGLFGLGIFLIIAAFAVPSVMGNRVIEEDGGIRIGNIAEAQVLSAMAADMGRAIDREKGDLHGNRRTFIWVRFAGQIYPESHNKTTRAHPGRNGFWLGTAGQPVEHRNKPERRTFPNERFWIIWKDLRYGVFGHADQ